MVFRRGIPFFYLFILSGLSCPWLLFYFFFSFPFFLLGLEFARAHRRVGFRRDLAAGV